MKSGIVTFGESKCVYSEAMKERIWVLGGESVTELYEYKKLDVVKNYIGSFSTNADDNIDSGGEVTSIDWDTGSAIFLGYFFC